MLDNTLAGSQWTHIPMAIVNTFIFKVSESLTIVYDLTSCIFFIVPTPEVMSVISDPESPIRPIGANVTLSCAIELSPAVDVPLTVNIQLTDPAGSMLNTTAPSVTGHTYTSTALVSSFGRDQSGQYTCRASFNSPFLFLADSRPHSIMANVTVGEISQLFNTHIIIIL